MTSRYLIIICILYLNCIGGSAYAQWRPSPSPAMEKLIQIKYNTELLLTLANSPHEKDSALVKYNTIRWQLDGLVYSIATDMVANNNTRAYHIIQSLCLNKKELRTHHPYKWLEIQWLQLSKDYYQIILKENDSKNINLTTNVFYIIKDSWGFLEGIQKIKSDKIKIMVDLLDQTRLRPPLDLLKK